MTDERCRKTPEESNIPTLIVGFDWSDTKKDTTVYRMISAIDRIKKGTCQRRIYDYLIKDNILMYLYKRHKLSLSRQLFPNLRMLDFAIS